jgi:hypothetical protein
LKVWDLRWCSSGRALKNYTQQTLSQLDAKTISYKGKQYSEYEITQIQRKQERNIRALKRQTVVAQDIMDCATDAELKEAAKADYQAVAFKLKTAEQELKAFCRTTNQDRDRFREQSIGFGRSQAQKAVQAAKKSLTSGGGSGIISIASNSHARDIELEKTIQKCINQEKPVFADDLAKFFPKIKPEKNRYIMSLHGTPKETYIYGKKIDARTLANIIKSRKDYNNEEIVLISCNTGNAEKEKVCFAQKLANEMNVTVHAPTRYGIINIFGKYYSGTLKGKRDGEFKSFYPQRKE